MSEKDLTTTTDIDTTTRGTGDKSLATREEARHIAPPVDIYETSDSLMVVADLPGVTREDLDIRVEDDVLTILGKTKYARPSNILRGEFDLVNFYRQFRLTEEVNQEKITAETKNGVLSIRLPKAEKTKPKQIAVKVS